MNRNFRQEIKNIFSTLLLTFLTHAIFGQISNLKAGLWGDKSTWNSNTIPTGSDDVILNFNIIVDIHASCNSLRLNGNNVTVNSGISFQILGTVTHISDSSYLSKTYGLVIDSSAVDTVQVRYYNYDNLKRLTSIVDTSEDFYSEAIKTINYSYHLIDSIPYKSEIFRVAPDDPSLTFSVFDTLVAYHFYDNYGNNLKDSVIQSHKREGNNSYYSTYTITTYSRGTNKIYGTTISYERNTPNDIYLKFQQRDTATLDNHGNIVTNRKYILNNSSQLWELNAVSVFSYDSGQNPFAKLSNFKSFGVLPSGETLYTDLPQNNNRLTQNEIHSIADDGSGSHYAYNYLNI